MCVELDLQKLSKNTAYDHLQQYPAVHCNTFHNNTRTLSERQPFNYIQNVIKYFYKRGQYPDFICSRLYMVVVVYQIIIDDW